MVTIPLAPRTARTIDLAVGERTGGPVFQAADGRRLDRHGAGRVVRKVARRAGIGKAVTPHTLRHANRGYGVFHLLVPMGSGGRVSRCSGQVLAWPGGRPRLCPDVVRLYRGRMTVIHRRAVWPR